jgi:hypothetical protein
MSQELAREIYTTVEQLVGSDEAYFQFERRGITRIHETDIEISQLKFIYEGHGLKKLRRIGAQALATDEWFNDAVIEDTHGKNRNQLVLSAYYPKDFFASEDIGVTTVNLGSNGVSVDGFGSNSRFGNAGKMGPRIYTIYDPETRQISHAKGDNPEDMRRYYDRFKWYLGQLAASSAIHVEQSVELSDDHARDDVINSVAIVRTLRSSTDYPEIVDHAHIFTASEGKYQQLYIPKDGSNPTIDTDYTTDQPGSYDQPLDCIDMSKTHSELTSSKH